MVQNFHLVSLDGSFNGENDNDCCNTIIKLQQVVNIVNTFDDVDKCVDFIDNIKEEKIFMISSGTLGQEIVPIVHVMRNGPEIGSKLRASSQILHPSTKHSDELFPITTTIQYPSVSSIQLMDVLIKISTHLTNPLCIHKY